ncbi:MAG: hypothetical protein OHK0029_07810 [Armatimonadaceae bacterium]
MAKMDSSLTTALQVNGAVACAVVDLDSGMVLGSAGGGDINLEVAGAGNSEVIRCKMNVMRDLGIDDEIVDILITLGQQYHLIRPITSKEAAGLFLYYVLDRTKANLALARHKLAEVERSIVI